MTELKRKFLNNPELKNNPELLNRAFKSDPSLIIFYHGKELTEKIDSALDREYLASEEDLQYNSELCNEECIMRKAIENNPRLIVYIGTNYHYSSEFLAKTLAKYTITKEDLENHPDLAKNQDLMLLLPQYRLYTPYLREDEKIDEVYKVLKSDRELTQTDLPFLNTKFGGKTSFSKLQEIVKSLSIYLSIYLSI